MSRALIVVGDRTSHGGVVIQGTAMSDAAGKMIARVGDKVSCPKRGCPNTGVIVSGDPTFIVDGQPVARHGDTTSCGATLIASQVVTYVDSGSSGEGGARGGVASSAAAGVGAAAVDTAAAVRAGEPSAASKRADYDQHFALLDDVTGAPLANRLYRIKWSGGAVEGRTDGAGLTQKIAASAPEDATIEVFPEGQ